MGLELLQEAEEIPDLPLSAIWRQSEKGDCFQAKKRILNKNWICQPPDLHFFLLKELWEIKSVKPHSAWYFIAAAELRQLPLFPWIVFLF